MPAAVRKPEVGAWVWTCRAGFEDHLFEELAWQSAEPTLLGPGLVATRKALDGRVSPAFGRAAFRVLWAGEALPPASECAGRFARASGGAGVHVQGWAVDDAVSLLRSSAAELFAEAVSAALPEEARLGTAEGAVSRGGVLGQWVAAGPSLWLQGVVPAREAISLAPGGRQRMRRPKDSPSRAAMKLEEALELLGDAPGRGEVCADLGAAPGGWTQRLVARGARVVAVDPANLSPELTRHPKVRHVKESAFAYAPEEPLDWLFCDMAWRPLEVAQLLAKWARRGWATQLVANLKLPMKDKNPILWRARGILEEAGWRGVKMRQLYHDRDEVTVTARRGG